MARREPDDPIQYATDTLNLTMLLYAVNPQDRCETITRTLLQSEEQYLNLVFRRLGLDFRPKDTAIVLWMMLDIIQARLATLERLQRYKTPQSGVDTTVRRARHSRAPGAKQSSRS
ncbi:MAG TPA: hypothetical protein VJU82_00870 [Acidobacteriaceae bacterium]|nr:hypothetical protein [Acidobacteriaceae bacterium]